MIRLGSDAVILTSDEAITLLDLIGIKVGLEERRKMPTDVSSVLSKFESVVKGFDQGGWFEPL